MRLYFSDFVLARFRQISPLIWIWLPLCNINLGIFLRQICHIPKDLTSTFARVPLYFKLFLWVFSLDISVPDLCFWLPVEAHSRHKCYLSESLKITVFLLLANFGQILTWKIWFWAHSKEFSSEKWSQISQISKKWES